MTSLKKGQIYREGREERKGFQSKFLRSFRPSR